jgi:hypothetical protein
VSYLPDEPGLDRHAWASEYESIEPLIREEPEEALPLLADLVQRMLLERGHDPVLGGSFDVSDEGRTVEAAMDLVRRTQTGEDLPPGDVAFAVDNLRETYAHLIADVAER